LSFVENKKAELAECLRGSGWLDEDLPDLPGVSDADSLREQFYDSIPLSAPSTVTIGFCGIL
jgi:hypothetical protein